MEFTFDNNIPIYIQVLEYMKIYLISGVFKCGEKLPSVIFLVDSKKEFICTKEARKLGIPTIGLIDSNCNPNDVDYVIPGNDDAIRAVKLIVSKMADAVIEANQGEAVDVEETVEETTEA